MLRLLKSSSSYLNQWNSVQILYKMDIIEKELIPEVPNIETSGYFIQNLLINT